MVCVGLRVCVGGRGVCVGVGVCVCGVGVCVEVGVGVGVYAHTRA